MTVIQRFGSGLQLTIPFHTLVLDGVFSDAPPGRLTFHPAPPPSDEDVAQVLATVRARVGRLLTRCQPTDAPRNTTQMKHARAILSYHVNVLASTYREKTPLGASRARGYCAAFTAAVIRSIHSLPTFVVTRS